MVGSHRPGVRLVIGSLGGRSAPILARSHMARSASRPTVPVRPAKSTDDLRARRLAAVAQVQEAVSASTEIGDFFQTLHSAICSVVEARSFAIYLPDEASGQLLPAYVSTPEPVSDTSADAPDGTRPFDDVSAVEVFRSGVARIFRRHSPAPLVRSRRDRAPRRAGPGPRILNAPILNGDRVLGVIQLQSPRATYRDRDVELVSFIARQAGTVLVVARAFDAERQERAHAEAAATIARVALAASSIDEAAPHLIDIVAQGLSAPAAALCVLTADGSALRPAAQWGPEGLDIPSRIPLPVDGAFSGSELLSGCRGSAVPLVARERLIGALIVQPGRHQLAASHDVARMADSLALAMDALSFREEERRQQQRQHELAIALAMMTEPVLVRTVDGYITYANAAALSEFGYSSGDLVGTHVRDLAVLSSGTLELEPIHRVLLREGRWRGEGLLRRQDGSEFPAQSTLSPILADDGSLRGVVAVVRNLAEELRVAEQLRQTERLAALGELVAGVAHEVNNPLTGISAFAQLLLEDPLSDEQREAVALIKRESDRAGTVIRDLLTFARKTGPRLVSVDLNALIEQTLRLRSYALRTAGIELALWLDPTLRPITGDDRQLQQVLLNLLMNAEHAMTSSATKTLTIRSANERGRVVVAITDTGCGMSPEVQKRVFEPFFTTKPEGQGTGLGLSVSYGIVRTHGGTLSVTSLEGAGATFRVAFPLERQS